MEAEDPAPEQEEARERRLLEAAVGGESEGLGELLESYRPRLERMVAFRLAPRLRGRIEPGDVLQEAYAEAVDRLPDYLAEPEVGFFVWVRFLALQKLQQHHRRHLGAERRDARREVPIRQGGSGVSSFALASAILDDGPTPSHQARGAEVTKKLEEALARMKEVDREILMLRHFEQLTNREAARTLGLTEPGASLRYVRALERMKRVVESVGLSSEGFG